MAYLFFLSYARANRTPGAVQDELSRFVDDLREEVRQVTGLPRDEVAFFDTDSIQIGAEWEERISEALRSSSVFLALCSPDYFDSQYCGREFHVFKERCASWSGHPVNPGLRAELIFPLMWVRLRTMPPVVSSLQFNAGGLPASYGEVGVRQMMRLSKYSDDYKDLLDKLAQMIVDAAEQANLPDVPTLGALSATPSAFHGGRSTQGVVPSAVTGGLRKACFVFIAGHKGRMESQRENVDAYGQDDSWFWTPYHPASSETIGATVQQIAAQMNIRADYLECDGNLVKHLAEARKTLTPTMIVADPWSVGLPEMAEPLQEYDGVNLLNCAMLVPWNDGDSETQRRRQDLEALLRDVCPQKHVAPPPNHHWVDVRSSQDLRVHLEVTLAEVQMRLMELGMQQPRRAAESRDLAAVAAEQGLEVGVKPRISNVPPSRSTRLDDA